MSVKRNATQRVGRLIRVTHGTRQCVLAGSSAARTIEPVMAVSYYSGIPAQQQRAAGRGTGRMLLTAALGPRRTRMRTVQWAGPMCAIRASRASCCSSSRVGALMWMGRFSLQAEHNFSHAGISFFAAPSLAFRVVLVGACGYGEPALRTPHNRPL